MNPRIIRIFSYLKKHQLDAFLVTDQTNVTYLAGFESSESWMLITQKKAYYLTDFRFVLEVKKKLKDITLIQYKTSFYHTLGELTHSDKLSSLGFSPSHLTLTQYGLLRKALRNQLRLVQCLNVVEDLRQEKELNEIQLIKKALKIHKEAHEYLKTIVKPKTTEFEVLRKLENFVKDKKCGFSFNPIIASGPNSCYPHAKVTGRKIRNNEIVLIDMGIDIKGYKSDLTRMFFLGRIPELILDAANKVKESQRRAISVIKPGIKISDVDYQARNYLKENKLDAYFGHALGHGVGLDIHENPRIAGKNLNTLAENMVITIEPAVYLPNKFGIRIEDMILVTKNGSKVLSDNIN